MSSARTCRATPLLPNAHIELGRVLVIQGKLADPAFVDAIESNQTFTLFDRFRTKMPGESAAIDALQRVIIMTPENLHLNSFMYEPILDMSDEHLRKLHVDIATLA